MSLNNSQVNDAGGSNRGQMPSASHVSWVPLVIGALSAAIVGSPLAGSALGTAFIAGLAALALGLLSRAGFDVNFSRSSAGFGTLIGACVVVVVLATGSVLGAIYGETWASWAAAIITFFVVALGLWLAARRSQIPAPATF